MTKLETKTLQGYVQFAKLALNNGFNLNSIHKQLFLYVTVDELSVWLVYRAIGNGGHTGGVGAKYYEQIVVSGTFYTRNKNKTRLQRTGRASSSLRDKTLTMNSGCCEELSLCQDL
ncbi:hypothetical protein CBL_02613 [Carabus blaptoides fortunei]